MDVNFLSEYLNNSDMDVLKTALQRQTIEEADNRRYNRRTGRRLLFPRRPQQQQRILRPGSLKNYYSILKKFGRFKVKNVGRDASITATLIERYNRHLNGEEANLKYCSRVNNVKTLNKHLIIPILNQEIPKPTRAANVPRNNKPVFPSKLIYAVVNYVWKYSTADREHAHKLKLIYFTGLRGGELNNLTYRTIVDSCSPQDRLAVIRLVNGKNGRERNIPILGRNAKAYYFDVFLPYIKLKFQKEVRNHPNDIETSLKSLIFDTPYQNTHKIFRRALQKYVLSHQRDLELLDPHEAIKGAGLHSIRADFATRTFKYLRTKLKDDFQAQRMIRDILGHSHHRVFYGHYVNQAGDVEDSGNDEEEGDDEIFRNANWGSNVRTVRGRPFFRHNTNMMTLMRDNDDDEGHDEGQQEEEQRQQQQQQHQQFTAVFAI